MKIERMKRGKGKRKPILIIVAILSIITGCKSKQVAVDNTAPAAQQTVQPTMPEGRLLRLEYRYQGMMMMPFSHFDLNRTHGSVEGCKLSFCNYGNELTFDVPDSLFDAARRIIEEEKIYEYDSYYGLPPEIENGMHDGYSWSFSASFENKQVISSHGRHVSPEGDGLNKINQLLEKAARECVEKSKDL